MLWHSLVYCILMHLVFGWDLQTYDDVGVNSITNNNDYSIVHVSIFYVRAFVTIRNQRNSTNHQVSIIESTWPENLLPIQARVFPNDLSHAKSQCDCNGIVQTIQTVVDRNNGLLWLLDNGSLHCAPKLILFDLLRGNNEVHRFVFNQLRSDLFKGIQLQDLSDKLNMPETRAIILMQNEQFLIMYSVQENHPKKLYLVKSGKNGPNKYLIPHEITMKNKDELLISDRHNGLWLANLNLMRSIIEKGRAKSSNYVVVVKYLGSLLGSSTAITVPMINDADSFNANLYYHLPRDGAILRWNFRKPLTAEGHEVLHLAEVPIVQIVFGGKGSVWIVYKHADELGDHCRRILKFFSFNSLLL